MIACANKCGNECGHFSTIRFMLHCLRGHRAGLAIENRHTHRSFLSRLLLHWSHGHRFDISGKTRILETFLLKAFGEACSNTRLSVLECRHRTRQILRLVFRYRSRDRIRIGNEPCTKRYILLKILGTNDSRIALIQNGHGNICGIFCDRLARSFCTSNEASTKGLRFSGRFCKSLSCNSILRKDRQTLLHLLRAVKRHAARQLPFCTLYKLGAKGRSFSTGHSHFFSGRIRHTGSGISAHSLLNGFHFRSNRGSNRLIFHSRCCFLNRIRRHSAKYRSIIEGTAALSAGHLIPLTAIRCSDYTVGHLRLFKLRSTVHVHGCSLAVGSRCCGADMTTRNLGPLHLEALHMGHIVAERSVCDLTADTAGYARCSGCNRGNGISIQGSAISGCHTAKGSAHKPCAAAKADIGTAFHNSITDIGVGAKLGSKACSKTTGSCSRTGCGTSGFSSEYASSALGTAAHAGNDPCGHHHFHGHTGSGLGNI